MLLVPAKKNDTWGSSLLAAAPGSPERPESVAELSPDGLFDRVVVAAGRGGQALLREQRDAGEPCGVIGQDVGAVRVTGDQSRGRGDCPSRLVERRAPSAAAPVTGSRSLPEMSCSISASPRGHLGIARPPNVRERAGGAVALRNEDRLRA
jgi:hypothetical protein